MPVYNPKRQNTHLSLWFTNLHYMDSEDSDPTIQMRRPTLSISERKYLKMCTTNGERNLISIRRQKECVDSKFVISYRMMHYLMWLKSYSIFTSCKGMHRRTDSHRDNSAHLRVVEFFFHCEAHQDVFNTHL